MRTTLFRYLPTRLLGAIDRLPYEIIEGMSEVRLRRYAPCSVTSMNRNLTFDESGRVCEPSQGMRLTEEEFGFSLARMTESSLYTCDEQVGRGFIPLPDGGRVGVCGRSNRENGFAEIYSLNLRIPRFLPDVASPLIERLRVDGLGGTLVCSPPGMGKTTFLKSAAFLLAEGRGIAARRVGIADERCELSPIVRECGLVDVVSLRPKAECIELLTRTMSPEVIICDEISASDADAVTEAHSSGVTLIASAHCESPEELLHRGRLASVLESKLFRYCVRLGYDRGYTARICETEELI